jgi:hypothetical protein
MLLVLACDRRGPASASPEGTPPPLSCPAGTTLQTESSTASWCVRPDGRRHGPYLERYPEGNERTRGQHTDGVRDGEWRGSWADGKPRSVEHYDRGKPTGMWITFFPDGTHATENEHRADGSVMHRTFRPDGSKVREGTYVDGVEDGEWTEWDSYGTATKRTYARKAPAAAAPSDLTGIPDCDRFIVVWRRCIAEKVPEGARAEVAAAFDETVATWREAARGPNPGDLATACKTAMDAGMQGMMAMGCTF